MARHLITSALPYVNRVKHLGNLAGSMLPADVYARYLRQRGHEVLYLCATDEHGTPAELAAADAGVAVAEFCAAQHVRQAAACQGFGITFDHFGRSSSAHNHTLTRQFGRCLARQGLIEERGTKQVYSRADARFLPNRYVIGTCPHCGNPAARGDQCESCARLLDPPQLLEPRSAISGSRDVEIRDSRHLYFLQSRLADRLRSWIGTKTSWPVVTRSIALKWLDEGIDDRGITRDLAWGVPVDRPGFEGKVYYVWFDAPIAYIAATREWADRDPADRDWTSWWLDASDVTYTQFMAKDNVPFHTIMFPAMLMGTGEPWKLADHIKGFNWLTYYGAKFSTSRRYGVFMDAALDVLPADYWRYFLVANAPESDDVDFTWELFAAQVNKDLADTFGNLVNRVLTLTRRTFGAVVPAGGVAGEAEEQLAEQVARQLTAYDVDLTGLRLRKATQHLKALWSLGNAYLERKAPWREVRHSGPAAAVTLRTALNLIYLLGVVSEPVIPSTATTVQRLFLGVDHSGRWPDERAVHRLDLVPPGSGFSIPQPLFRKITVDDVAEWRKRFGAPEL